MISQHIHEIAPDGAWTWFNDERAVFHGKYLFVGYILQDGRVGATRYDPSTGEARHMVLGSEAARQQDDHNNPSFTVLPDGCLLAIYARHHKDTFFFCRRSRNPAPASDADWEPEVRETTAALVTYSNTYRLTEEDNRIYNFFRGINFNPSIVVSEDDGRSWKPARHLIRAGEGKVRPYTRYASNGSDRIDAIYTDGHPRDCRNSIYHLYYRNGAVHYSDGSIASAWNELPLDHDAGETGTCIYSYQEDEWEGEAGPDDYLPFGRGWVWDLHYGLDGHPRCVYQVLPVPSDSGGVELPAWPDSRIHYYYARWTGAQWETHCIAHAGRGLYEKENFYAGGIAIDPDFPEVVYASTNAKNPFENLGRQSPIPLNPDDRYELWRGVTDDGGATFSWEAVTEDSEADNLRPIVPAGHSCRCHVLWFQGRYTTYEDYRARILGIIDPGSS